MRIVATSTSLLLLLSGHEVHSFSLPLLSTSASTVAPSKSKIQRSKEEIKSLQDQTEAALKRHHDTDSWNALFVSCPERPDPMAIAKEEGTIPADFPPGAYLRVGPNGADATDGFYDGDGMIHCVTFPPEPKMQPTYSATYIDTKGRQLEQQSGKKFQGTLSDVPRGLPMIQSIVSNALAFRTLQAQKDTCNTALAEHGGKILALMEQCPPSEVEIGQDGRLRTVEASSSLNGAIDTTIPISGGVLSAHGRTCPKTGDRIHVSYRSDQQPYLRMDVFAPGFALKESVGIDIPTPIFSHDCAITENYAVVLDLPLTLRTNRILRDKFPVEYEPDHPARIGLVPRGDNNKGEIRWFDCEPGVVLHAVNAWETDDANTVIVQGFRSEPIPQACYLEQFAPSYYYEYSIDLTTGVVTEQTLNPEHVVEFPVINEKLTGLECPACYCLSAKSIGGPLEVYAQPQEGVIFGAIAKLAAVDSDKFNKGDVVGKFAMPEGFAVMTEPTVVPKVDQDGEYILIIANYVPKGVNWKDVANDYDAAPIQSKVMMLDGDDLDAGPVYSATLPYHVPYGLHSGFIDWKNLK